MGTLDLELPDTTFFCCSFCFEISKPVFHLYGNKSRALQACISALQEFVTVGKADFLALRGGRVNKQNIASSFCSN